MTPPVETLQIELPGIGEPEALVGRHRVVPAPGPGQALVRMEATGVSFAEQQMRLGKYYDQPPFPFVPGYDLVGVVEKLGPGPADVSEGQRVAAGGVGSILVQLARAAGLRVIGVGSTPQQDAIASLGAAPVDYRGEDVPGRVAQLAPDGVAAVFDHVGGEAIVDSWRMLAPGGTLVSYGTAATKDQPGNARIPVLKLFARLAIWNALPNRRRATFFNFWAGSRRRTRFRADLRHDLEQVFGLLREGALTARVAAEYPLSQASAALRFAERRGVVGKVVLTPDRARDGIPRDDLPGTPSSRRTGPLGQTTASRRESGIGND